MIGQDHIRLEFQPGLIKFIPGIHGERIEYNNAIKVIIISSEIKKDFVATVIKCGIDGYLPKDVDKATLVEAIRSVMQGHYRARRRIVKG